GRRVGAGQRLPGDAGAAFVRDRGAGRDAVSVEAEAALAAMFREEWPRLVGAALRITGDLQAAEDSVQETLLVALDRWPLQGVLDRTGARLMTVCRNRARNLVRDS